jgi:hypothetical protein
MPYKLDGSAVMVYKAGKWHVLKRHPSHAKALAHLRALYKNVEGASEEAEALHKQKPKRKGNKHGGK